MTDDDIGNVIEKIIRSHVHEELRDWMYRSLVSDLGEGDVDDGLARLEEWVQMTRAERTP